MVALIGNYFIKIRSTRSRYFKKGMFWQVWLNRKAIKYSLKSIHLVYYCSHYWIWKIYAHLCECYSFGRFIYFYFLWEFVNIYGVYVCGMCVLDARGHCQRASDVQREESQMRCDSMSVVGTKAESSAQ